MFWVRFGLLATAALFVFDRLFDLGPLTSLALLLGFGLYLARRQRSEETHRYVVVAVLILLAFTALELLDAGVLPVLRI